MFEDPALSRQQELLPWSLSDRCNIWSIDFGEHYDQWYQTTEWELADKGRGLQNLLKERKTYSHISLLFHMEETVNSSLTSHWKDWFTKEQIPTLSDIYRVLVMRFDIKSMDTTQFTSFNTQWNSLKGEISSVMIFMRIAPFFSCTNRFKSIFTN